MATITPFISTQFFDDDGLPIPYGRVAFYETGTTTNKNTYSSENEETLNPNPVELDGAGRANIFGNGVYDCVLYDKDLVEIATKETVTFNGDDGDSSFLIVESLLQIKSLASGIKNYVLMTGENTVGDGRQRLYYWDDNNMEANDDISIIQPASVPFSGRWVWLQNNADPLFQPFGRYAESSQGGPDVSTPTEINVHTNFYPAVSSTVAKVNMLVLTPLVGDLLYFKLINAEHGTTIWIKNVSATYDAAFVTDAANQASAIVAKDTGFGATRNSGFMTYDATTDTWIHTFPNLFPA